MSQGEKIAARESYDRTLAELGEEHEDSLVLDTDLASSTRTAVFRKAFLEHHINCGTAEQNMVGVAAGIATAGRVAFANLFTMFAAGRAYGQIRNSVGYPQFNMKIAATYGGISVGESDATYQCNEDFALMRTIPGMVVMVPSDDVEIEAMVRAAYAHRGPVCIRFSRLTAPVFDNPETHRFEIGKTITMRKGKGIATTTAGLSAASTMETTGELMAEGIETRVTGIHTIRPLNEEVVLRAVEEIGKVVTVEEYSIVGGLGSAVTEVLAEQYPAKLKRVGVYDRYAESGPIEALVHHYGLDSEDVYSAVEAFPV